ncbi:MAG: hypothetical protein LBT67_02480, partial [Holosporaceae bacterium]|nr:hypothetical protein [Holosporaceae bacterium]
MKKLLIVCATVAGGALFFCNQAKCNDDGEAYSDAPGLFDHIFFGLGVGCSFDKDEISERNSANRRAERFNNFMGALLLGSGRALNAAPIYFGGEIGLNFAKAKSGTSKINGTDVKIKRSGFVPSFAFRAGYVSRSNLLFFLRLGISHVRSKAEYPLANGSSEYVSFSKLAPTIGVGVEKAICAK